MVHICSITTATATAVTIAVSFASALTLVSAHPNMHLTSSSSSGHGPHALEKRAPAAAPSCSTTYTPVAAGQYPVIDCVPFIQDPQVQTWLKLVDFSKTPVFPPSQKGVCPTDLTTLPQEQCWWTCQKCDAPDDITSCPTTGTWGLTFDDGPSPDSPRLYDNLLQHNQKATLFIVGSRAISFPATLKRAYNEGHQIAIHTWSHPSMTSLSNEQIVAELKWTEKAIFDTIGVTPIYWRPPFGDVDARVRNIATQLGLKTSIWTQNFDTNDWNIPAGVATPQSVVDTFKGWLAKIPSMPHGFIVLEHDLFPEEVNVSINGVLPVAYATKGLLMQPIAQCLNDGKPYREGAGTFKFLPGGGSNGTNSGNKNSVTGLGGAYGGQGILVASALTSLIVFGMNL
ncbi:chitin deacetylase [Linnemannia gamsii]|uniref:Chitin deacetylase n=1 Tax=Linnemannia gamsii TaxID=64522 RepID=A0ABQ7KFI3_9FUNG|nr:chitin deacetylase [Linnemannia gamsii]